MELARIRGDALASALKTVRIEQEALNVLALALRDSALREALERAVSAIASTSFRSHV